MDASPVAKLEPESRQQVQAFIEDVLRRSGLSGISVALNVNGDTMEVAAGVSDRITQQAMTPEICFELGCINKLLTSLFVLSLVDVGAIAMDMSVAACLPEFAKRGNDAIRIRNLLSHTAGYQGENWADPDVIQEYDAAEFCRSIERRRQLFAPGTQFDYSHSGAVVLARIGEAISGQPRSDWLREHIYRPLGIEIENAAEIDSPSRARVHAFNPAMGRFEQAPLKNWGSFWAPSLGGPWLTMRELARIGRAIVAGTSVVSPTVREQLLRPVIRLPGLVRGSKAEVPYAVFGHGCARFANGCHGVRATAAGGSCALRFDLAKQIVIAVAVNAEAPHLRDLVIDKLHNALLPEDALTIPELNPLPETGFTADELSGSYRGAKGHGFDIVPEMNGVLMSVGHNPATETSTHPASILLQLDARGGVRLPENGQGLALGFFRDQATRQPHLMVGTNLYVRHE